MEQSRALRLQVAVIGISALVLALVINYPDFHNRPRAPTTFFWSLLAGTSIGLFALGIFGVGSDRKRISSAFISTGVLWLAWLFVAYFLWVNTYGE